MERVFHLLLLGDRRMCKGYWFPGFLRLSPETKADSECAHAAATPLEHEDTLGTALSLERREGFFLLGLSPCRAQGPLTGGCQDSLYDLPNSGQRIFSRCSTHSGSG